jgi:hypothetical protein
MSTPSGFPDGPPGPNHSQPGDGTDTPAPGELGIVEKRTWKTWQLASAVVIAVVIGMALNYHTVGASQSTGSGGSNAYVIPSGSGATTTTVAGSGGASDSSTTTTPTTGQSSTTSTTSAKGHNSTTTTSAGGQSSTSTTTASTSPVRLLLGPVQQSGGYTSTPFTTTAAGWNIGWAFQCSSASTTPSFQVFVVPAGAQPTGAAAITESGLSGQAVTVQSAVGAETLVVQAPTDCMWVVKVTGS